MGHSFALAIVIALAPCAPSARALIAEVFYDAVGDDTGHEFVELFNPGSAPVSLAGARLEAGDGAGPGRWTLRWTGAAPDSVPAHGRFVIGGALVSPPAQAIIQLDLQNGPDAVRLVWPDGASEVVGYGALGYAEYFCGQPAVDVPSGQSLARIPDDADLGTNALDFRPAVPSPGRANQPGRDAAMIPGSLVLTPEQPGARESARLDGVVANLGRAPIAAGEAAIEAQVDGGALLLSPLASALAAGDSARFTVDLPPQPPGKRLVLARVRLEGDDRPENDADSIRVRVGPGPLEITEVQFHPRSGEGEWVEVRSRADQPLDLATFTLSDRGRTRAVPESGAARLEPESLAVLAQDRAALMARYPAIDRSRVLQASPWPALNNVNDSTGFADAVVLRESDGTRCDRVDYSAAGIPDGVPIEMRDGLWLPSSDPDGTPLAPPVRPPAIAGSFDLEPRRWRVSAGAPQIIWSLPWPRARVSVDAYDLAGRRVARLMPESAASGHGARPLPSGVLPAGLYLVVLRARAESGEGMLTKTRALRIDGTAP